MCLKNKTHKKIALQPRKINLHEFGRIETPFNLLASFLNYSYFSKTILQSLQIDDQRKRIKRNNYRI